MPLIVDIMTENIFLILHLGFFFAIFLGCSSLAFSPSLSFFQPVFGSSAHRCVSCYGHHGHGIIPAVLWHLGVLYKLKESSPAFIPSWWRLPLYCEVSVTFNAVGCFRATCWSCLGIKLSPASTHSCLHGRGWGKRSRMYNVLVEKLYHIWQHYSIGGCQEYDWHNFLRSFSDLRCKFDMCSGKHIFQENFEEEFIPYIAVLLVFTLLNRILVIFTISLCLMWVITYNCATNFWNQTF